MGENEDLLLRIQSDVASGVAGVQSFAQGLQQLITVNQQASDSLQSVSGQMYNLLNVQTQAQQSTSRTTEGFSKGQAQVITYAAALGALREVASKVTSAFVGQTAALAAHAEQIGNAAQQANVSSRFYQELELRLERLGLGAGAARMSLLFFNRAIDDAREGTGKLANIMQELGVDVSRNRGTAEILKDVAIALDQMNDAQKRVSFQRSMFGRTGMSATTWLHDLAKDSDELTNSWKKMGTVLDEDMERQLKAFDDSLDDSREAVKGLSNQIRAHQSEALKPFVDGFTKITSAIAESTTAMDWLGRAAGILSVSFAASLIPQVVALTRALIALIPATALASGGLTLLFGAIGAAAAAWMMYRENVQAAGTQTEDTARKCKTASEMIADSIKNLKPLSAHTAELEEAHKVNLKLTKDQQKVINEGLEAQKQADEDARLSLEKRMKGERAALDLERDITIKRLERKRDEEIKEKEGEPGFINTKKAIEQKYQAEIEGIRTAFNEKAKALEQSQQQALTGIAIDGELKRQQSTLSLERETLEQKRKLHQVNETEYFTQLKSITDREYEIQKNAAEQLIKLAQQSHDPSKIADAREKASAIERKYTEDTLAQANERTNALKAEKDARADALGQVAQLYEQAFGTPQSQRVQQLQLAQEQLLRTLEKYPDQAEKVRLAYAKMIQDAKAGTIDLRDTFSTAIDDMFSGVIMGTRSMSDVFDAFQASMVKSFTKGFADALMEKLNFDTEMNVNFLEDLPGMAKQGASRIGQIFSNLFSLLSNGSGVGPGVSVDSTAASFMGGGGFNLGGLLGGGSVAASGAGRIGGLLAGEMGPPTAAMMGAGSSAGAGAASGLAGGWIGAIIAGAMGTINGALQWGSGKTTSQQEADITRSLFGGGDIRGLTNFGLGMNSTWNRVITGAGSGGLTELAQFVSDLLGFKGFFGMGAPPTGEHVKLDSIRDLWDKTGMWRSEKSWGDHSIISRSAQDLFENKRSGEGGYIYDLLFGGETFDSMRGDKSIGPAPYDLETGRRELMPGTTGQMSFAVNLGIFDGNKEDIAKQGTNAFINNARAMGITASQAKGQLLELAKAAGVDMADAINDATKAFMEGTISQEDYNDAIAGAINLFTDLPARVDATQMAFVALAQAEGALVDVNGKLIFDAERLKEVLDDITQSSNLTKSALQAYYDAAFPDQSNADELQRQRENEVALGEARIKYLEEQRDSARALGDTVSEAQLDMELQSERAALAAGQAAKKALSPQEALMQSIKDGLKKSIIDGIIEGVVQGGMLQVALAPVMAAIKHIGEVIADPQSTAADVNNAFTSLGNSIQSIGPIMDQFAPYIDMIFGQVTPFIDYIDKMGVGNYSPDNPLPGHGGMPTDQNNLLQKMYDAVKRGDLSFMDLMRYTQTGQFPAGWGPQGQMPSGSGTPGAPDNTGWVLGLDGVTWVKTNPGGGTIYAWKNLDGTWRYEQQGQQSSMRVSTKAGMSAQSPESIFETPLGRAILDSYTKFGDLGGPAPTAGSTTIFGTPLGKALLDSVTKFGDLGGPSPTAGTVRISVVLNGPFVGGDQSSFRELARLVGNETHAVLQRNRLIGR